MLSKSRGMGGLCRGIHHISFFTNIPLPFSLIDTFYLSLLHIHEFFQIFYYLISLYSSDSMPSPFLLTAEAIDPFVLVWLQLS